MRTVDLLPALSVCAVVLVSGACSQHRTILDGHDLTQPGSARIDSEEFSCEEPTETVSANPLKETDNSEPVEPELLPESTQASGKKLAQPVSFEPSLKRDSGPIVQVAYRPWSDSLSKLAFWQESNEVDQVDAAILDERNEPASVDYQERHHWNLLGSQPTHKTAPTGNDSHLLAGYQEKGLSLPSQVDSNPTLMRPLPQVGSATVEEDAAGEASLCEEPGSYNFTSWCGHKWSRACDTTPMACDSILEDVINDHCHYYRWRTARDFGLVLSGAAVLANTSMDQHFRNWVQDDVRSTETDHFSNFWKNFGEGEIFIPAYAALAGAGLLLQDIPACNVAGDFGYQVSRSYLVGLPPMLLMQYTTGGSRPGEDEHDSYWRPFTDNNGVSGHAFVGAVPFMTAANMVENRFFKLGLYTLSTLPGWSRVNDDDHYLSQICLGWCMAYLACRSVDATETDQHGFRMMPMVQQDAVGVSFVIER